jgi:hypothetical protein
MKASELLRAAVVHVAVLVLALVVIAKLAVDDADFGWIAAAVVATFVGALSFHRRHPEKASLAAKATLGAVLAVLAVVEALVVLQCFWRWTPHPEVIIPIVAAGTFVFPVVIFNSVQKSLEKARTRKR